MGAVLLHFNHIYFFSFLIQYLKWPLFWLDLRGLSLVLVIWYAELRNLWTFNAIQLSFHVILIFKMLAAQLWLQRWTDEVICSMRQILELALFELVVHAGRAWRYFASSEAFVWLNKHLAYIEFRAIFNDLFCCDGRTIRQILVIGLILYSLFVTLRLLQLKYVVSCNILYLGNWWLYLGCIVHCSPIAWIIETAVPLTSRELLNHLIMPTLFAILLFEFGVVRIMHFKFTLKQIHSVIVLSRLVNNVVLVVDGLYTFVFWLL